MYMRVRQIGLLKLTAGFTLVELSIVLVVIGLLITGILKGSELVSSARVKATIQQMQSIDSAKITFRDSYRFLPGDITNPGGRIPNCTSANCIGSPSPLNGNGRIDERSVQANYLDFNTENPRFFVHLAITDMISGINTGPLAMAQFGDGLLETALGGSGYGIGYWPGGVFPTATENASAAFAGHYLSTRSSAQTTIPGGFAQIKPVHVQQIDLKLDDGSPASGVLRGAGASPADIRKCESPTNTNEYNNSGSRAFCDFYFKLSN